MKIENSAEYKHIKQKRDQIDSLKQDVEKEREESKAKTGDGLFEFANDNPDKKTALDKFEKVLDKQRTTFLTDEDFDNKEKFVEYIEDYVETYYGPLMEEFENTAYFIKDCDTTIEKRVPPRRIISSLKLINQS